MTWTSPRNPTLKRTTRRRSSLRLQDAGIPDGRDILAIYFWWARQSYYTLRVQDTADQSADVASSVLSVLDADDYLYREPPSPTMHVDCVVDDEAAVLHLLAGIGGQFD